MVWFAVKIQTGTPLGFTLKGRGLRKIFLWTNSGKLAKNIRKLHTNLNNKLSKWIRSNLLANDMSIPCGCMDFSSGGCCPVLVLDLPWKCDSQEAPAYWSPMPARPWKQRIICGWYCCTPSCKQAISLAKSTWCGSAAVSENEELLFSERKWLPISGSRATPFQTPTETLKESARCFVSVPLSKIDKLFLPLHVHIQGHVRTQKMFGMNFSKCQSQDLLPTWARNNLT